MEYEPVKAIDGQCGTCVFADCFDYPDSPGGPEDGVHCISLKHAEFMDEQTGSKDYTESLTSYGFLNLWRLELVAEEEFHCPQWVSKEKTQERR